jgi:eukaryotic-like serine/threonine-protein kinase
MSSLPCPPQHWPRFSELLDAAMELPEATRTDWLNGLAGADAEFRPWLARVLGGAAASRTASFLDRPTQEGLTADSFHAGDRLGPYRLDALLGEGGMGQVWRACRDDDGPQREVALKLPQPELLGGPFRARFRRERDVLAALSHPNIAQLYDAGVGAEGHPYLALELVRGRPITDHCREGAASLDRRLALMGQVLEALSYAHARLIVHRDIKPSNVLVTPEGAVKLLDFGIAKLLRAQDTGETLLTQPAALLATPGYAAPEQFTHGAVTVATDVFSAGVLLFELVTGQRPFSRVPADAQADAAPLASQRADAAAIGCPEGTRLRSKLRGDLDAVIAKALALSPADRYASTEAFGRDVRRCREGLPVAARRVRWVALAAKFVRRNKVGVALASVLALAIVGGTAGVAWQARRAEREAVRANAIKDFLISLFRESDPRTGKPKAVSGMTAKDVLDAGADRADTAFAHDPVTEIELLTALQDMFDVLEDSVRAERVGERRLALARQLYGSADPRVVDGTISLVGSQIFFLDEAKAQALLETIRKPVFKRYGANSKERALWLHARANSLRATHGGWQEAVADETEAIRILGNYFPDDDAYPDALDVLAGYRYDTEEFAASLVLLDRMKAIEQAHHGFDAIEEMMYTTNVGMNLSRLGQADEAEKQFEKAQNLAEQRLGKQSTWYLANMIYRGLLAHMAGDRARSHALFQQAMDIGAGRSASTGQATAMRRAYGTALDEEGDAAASIPLLEAALAQTRLHPKDEANLRRNEGTLGDAYDQAGRTEEARALLQAARTEWMQYGPPHATQTLAARERWAQFLADHGDAAGADTEYNAVLAMADKPIGPAALAAAGLARLALTRGDTAAADKYSAQALATLGSISVQYNTRVKVDVWRTRAEVLLRLGRQPEGRDLAAKATKSAEAWDAPMSAQLARARETLRKAQEGQGALPPGPPLGTSP